jgi:hypothetical protein
MLSPKLEKAVAGIKSRQLGVYTVCKVIYLMWFGKNRFVVARLMVYSITFWSCDDTNDNVDKVCHQRKMMGLT